MTGITQFGLNLLFGADYYFNDAIYVGFEAGIGLSATKVGDHTISTDDVVAFNIQYNNEDILQNRRYCFIRHIHQLHAI